MRTRPTLILAASILLGLFLGLAIRRARMPAPLPALDARAQLPSRERIGTALLRAQIRDLHTETIANLALRARELGDVIALWYGEGDMVTPAFISRSQVA